MPELSVFVDVEEMDNRYIGKCIIYVEGRDDRNVWERIVGSELADRLEFKVPLAAGSGSEIVLNRVSTERPSNSKIFGLVDGEVAAQLGEVARLINCSDVLFELRGPRCDGILFLSTHELENVLVGHSSLAEFVERNLEPRRLGAISHLEVEDDIRKQAKRFYVAALIKYTWAHMYFQGLASGVGNVDHFRSNNGITAEIQNAKQNIRREFSGNARVFRQQLMQIGQWVRSRMDVVEREGGRAGEEIVRLAEGKGLLIKLRSNWSFTTANEGLLVERVYRSDFALRFREQLVAATGA